MSESNDLKSHRYVTSGYTNVFHRAFLYGLGLSLDDMQKPFVGLALAHSEAVPGHGSVRALADVTRRATAAAGLTEREFTVPESLLPSAAGPDAVVARELAADSAELVVRGHWYDALVGVAATVPGVAGLAQSIARLRIPGVVLVPQERSPRGSALAGLVGVLAEAGLAVEFSVDDLRGVTGRMEELAEQVLGAVPVDGGERLGALGATLDAAVWDEVVPHLAAVAHEWGVAELSWVLELEGRVLGPSGEVAGASHPGLVDGPLRYDRL